ncbi:MAG: TonB-dependent receptor [Bacteroidaceae bacterium]|nr:TonB-dependent receptor [Bacteroidaceae bacterium]
MKKNMFLASLLFSALSLSAFAVNEDVVADSIMRDIVVTGTRNATSERKLTTTVSTLNHEQLTKMERISILPTLSEQVPNVFVTQRGLMGFGVSGGAAGGISVRGISSASGQAMVLVDGHPQYQGIFGHAIADAYQTMVAERVEVVRGPSSLLYGSNAMGGVINIITRQQPKDGVHTDISVGAGSYGSVQADAHNSVRAHRFFSDVALNYQRSDNHRPSMGFYQYGGFAKAGYDFSANWRAWASFNMTHFAASNPGPVSAPLLDADQWINRGVVEVVAENHYGRTSGAVSLYHNFGRHKINDGHVATAAPKDYYFRSKDALTGVSAHQTFELVEGNVFTVGFDYQNIYGECWNSSIATGERLNRQMEQNMHYPLDKNLTELAGYLDVRQDLTDWWTVEAGVRLDHHSEAGSEWVPQGGFVFRPLDSGELKLNVGKGFRVPNLKEMYLYGIANPDLKPERLWNYEMAWKHSPCNAFTYGINLFYLKAENLIGSMMVASLGRMANYNTGSREHYGAELEATYRVCSDLTLTTNHSYLHMDSPLLAAPEYKGYLGADYRLGKFSLTGGFQLISGLCTNVQHETKESFVLLNAAASYHLLPQLKLWVRGENLLAQKYEINEGFPMPKATFMAGVHVSF